MVKKEKRSTEEVVKEETIKDTSLEKEKKTCKNKKVCIIICIVVLVVIAAALVVLNKFNTTHNKNKKDVYVNEYDEKIKDYGDKITAYIKDYMDKNNKEVPYTYNVLKDTEKSIPFDKNFSCEVIQVNYDGSFYMGNCDYSIEGSFVAGNLNYGEAKNSSDFVQIYEKETIDEFTGEVVKYYDYIESYLLYKKDEYNSYTSKEEAKKNLDKYGYKYLSTYQCDYAYCRVESKYGDQFLILAYNKNPLNENKEEIEALDVKNNKITGRFAKQIQLSNSEKTENADINRLIIVDGKVKDLIISNEEGKYAIYNLEKDELITEFIYSSYEPNEKLYENGNKKYIIMNSDESSFYVNLDAGSLFKEKYFINEEITYNNNKYYVAKSIDSNGIISNEYILLDSNKKVIYDFNKLMNENNPILHSNGYTINSNGYTIYSHEDYSVEIYDFNNKLIKKLNNYNMNVVAKDYLILTSRDKSKKVILVDNKGNTTQLCELTENQEVTYGGYAKKDNELVVSAKILDYSIKGKEEGYYGGYEYYYIIKNGKIGKIEIDDAFEPGLDKPILYLYPTKDNTKVSVKFEKPQLLTTTYPKFNNEWNVVANKNGDLYDSNGKYYYGLYWEESKSKNIDFKEGFYVTKDNAIEFLEEKLSIIGLNDKERNEFIMYWLPILEKNGKNLVYFELTEERENDNKLIISPKPDSMLRVAIHIKKVDKQVEIKEQKLTSFKRSGFTVVEWGGTVHK